MKENAITVEGIGRLRIEPDRAVIKCSVEVINRSYAEANKELNRRVDLLRQAVVRLGGDKADLKTKDYSVNRETKRNSKTDDYEFVGYLARHSLELRLPLDKEKLNQAVEALLGSGAEARVDVGFTVADPEPIRAKLLAAAVENARQRAETITQAAGIKLGKIQNITYGVVEVRVRSEALYCMEEQSGPSSPDITAGDLSAEDSVTVTWELVQEPGR